MKRRLSTLALLLGLFWPATVAARTLLTSSGCLATAAGAIGAPGAVNSGQGPAQEAPGGTVHTSANEDEGR